MQLQWKGKVPSRYKYDPIMWVMSQNQMLWRHISTAFYIVSNNHLLQSSLRVLVRVGASVHKPCLSVCVGIWRATQMSGHRVAGLQQERDCWKETCTTELTDQRVARLQHHQQDTHCCERSYRSSFSPPQCLVKAFWVYCSIEWMFRTLLCEKYHSLKSDVKKTGME